MKYFLIIWICINDPNISLEKTCEQLIMDQGYRTVLECNEEDESIYQTLKPAGNVYLTSFCSLKPSV